MKINSPPVRKRYLWIRWEGDLVDWKSIVRGKMAFAIVVEGSPEEKVFSKKRKRKIGK